jgi:PhnB protein
MSDAKPIPDNSTVIIPMLVCHDSAAEMEFCKATFGAVELGRRPAPDGSIVHALLKIGEVMLMIHGEVSTLASRAPQSDGSSPVVLYVYVQDVDAVIARALAAGARMLVPIKNQFWGDRMGRIIDPAGHVWNVATRIEKTNEAQRNQRYSTILSGDELEGRAEKKK